MTPPIGQAQLDRLFAIFVKHAIAGARCPTNSDLPPGSQPLIRELARRERILIEVSGKNWRVITILDGPHAGKKTATDPHGRPPYRVIGIEDRLHGEIYQRRGKIW